MFPILLKEYPQNNGCRMAPNFSPLYSQMLHHPQSALWGYNVIGQPQQSGYFVQNQPLPPGKAGKSVTENNSF